MNKYKEMFSAAQWDAICNEAYKERFIADYSYSINNEPESFEPRTQEEREYFDDAYKVYLDKRGYDIADSEVFGSVQEELTKRGWVTITCPCCEKVIITKASYKESDV